MTAISWRSRASALLASLAVSACVGPGGGPLSIGAESGNGASLLASINESAQKCWFKSGDRAFRRLALIPELDTHAGNPRLLLVERGRSAALPRLVIEASGDPVSIDTYGPLAGSPISTRINRDISAWSKGGNSC